MAGSFKKEDLRIKKTYKFLVGALLVLLNRKSFNQITVNDLCEEALISRATFYVHFNDKYDLLKCYFSTLSESFLEDVKNYEKLSQTINQYIANNHTLIENIIIDANNETLGLINDFMESMIGNAIEKNDNVPDYYYSMISNFCAGGIVNLLLFLVKKNFPPGKNLMTPYLYETISNMINVKSIEEEKEEEENHA